MKPKETIRILMIEDNPADVRLVHLMLEECLTVDLQLSSVARVTDALSLLKREKFGCILLDLNLPDSQGLVGLEKITRQEPAVPVILLTSLDDETIGTEAIQKHAADYLVKGQINTGLLVRSIRYATERKHAEEALRASERRVRLKLDSILSPDGDIGNLELADIIDVSEVQTLMDSLYEFAHIPMAIVDIKGKVLVGIGWQEICTKFHRVNPQTCQNCIESDTHLTSGVVPGEFRLYKCKNNMWDVSTPVIIGGQYLGNVFMGQFFFEDETVDYEQFRSQAKVYGFPEREYLEALVAVPRLSRQTVEAGMAYFIKFAQVLSRLSYSNIKLARLLAERDNLMDSLRESQIALRAREEQFRRAIEDAPIPVVLYADNGEILQVSGTWSEFLGCDMKEIPTIDIWLERFCAEGADDFRGHMQAFIQGKKTEVDIEFKIRSQKGPVRDWSFHASLPGTLHDGRRFIVGMAVDVTEQKAAAEILKRDKQTLEKLVTERSEQLLTAQLDLEKAKRLSEIGTLAASVAHELRNPLAVIGMATANIKRKAKTNDFDRHIANIERKIVDSNLIINNLLYYARIRPPTYEPVDLHALLGECVSLAINQNRKQINFKKKINALKDLTIEVDGLQIKEVFSNILANACDAIEGNEGKIEIDGVVDEKRVKVSIQDNGGGISEEALKRILEPFYTTKAKGTGLGLSICNQIIGLHGGTLDFKSTVGQGTTVTICLPKKKML